MGLGHAWTQWIGSSPTLDLCTLALSMGTLFAAGGLATLIPAIAAASVHPNMALRAD